jgi:hypothetical protein
MESSCIVWGRILWIEKGQYFDLKSDEIYIGREPACGICLPYSMNAASKIHCKIQKEPGGCCVIDSSANGTFLNPADETSQRKCKIKDGQRVHLKVGDVIGVTVGYRQDGSVELAHFRLELPLAIGRSQKEDEETCFEAEPHQRTSAPLCEQHQHEKSMVHIDEVGCAVGCKRPRAADDLDQHDDAEIGALEEACRSTLARANQAQVEVDRLIRSTEQLEAKLRTTRSVSVTSVFPRACPHRT